MAERIGAIAAGRTEQHKEAEPRANDHIGHVLGSIFALLALLLGFSFNIALDRYDTRRADVVAEANAIGSAHYRAGFVAELGDGLRASLARYASERVRYGKAGQAERRSLEIAAAEQREEIAEAARRIEPIAETALGSSLISAVNEVLDLGVQREANIRAKLPGTVFALLIGLALIGAGMTGFAYPSGGVRQGPSLLLYVLLTLTIALIANLDRPEGAIDKGVMVQLAEQLNASGSDAP
jgi:hypothetical protein